LQLLLLVMTLVLLVLIHTPYAATMQGHWQLQQQSICWSSTPPAEPFIVLAEALPAQAAAAAAGPTVLVAL